MSIFIVLFSSIFIFVIVVRYLKINKNSSSESNIRITSDISVAVSGYEVVDECFKATNDCDVTYKTYKSHSNILQSNELDYFLASNLASNDEKNSTKYQATSMQDIYPTDLA